MSLRSLVLIVGVAAVASCAPRPAARPPAEPVQQVRAQAPPPRPQPMPSPPPAASGWQDAALTAGDWSYGGQGATSSANYGPPGAPVFTVRCEPSRQVSLARVGASSGTALTFRTSSGARAVAAVPQQGALVATLPASDRFLDAVAFSRGRFTVEAPGIPMLILPAWPEVARVVEDCRA